jgi:hypothetical protein
MATISRPVEFGLRLDSRESPSHAVAMHLNWSECLKRYALPALREWWPGTESNRRRQPFQGCALPTELPGREVVSPFYQARVASNSSRLQSTA